MALSSLIRSFLAPRVNRNLIQPTSSILSRRSIDENQDANSINYTQTRGAARKGKRIARARLNRLNAANKRLQAAQKPKRLAQIASVKLDKTLLRFQNERSIDISRPPPPEDDVYFSSGYRKKKHNFDEILEFHRQTAHPDVFNQPDALVSASIELNLKMKIKKKRYIERIESTLLYPHVYSYQVRARKIVALSKDESDQERAKEAGAIIVGSNDVANLIKTKQLTFRDFDHLVCHTDYLAEFAAIKGMKNQPFFPSKQRGNFGDDIVGLVTLFKDGVDYCLKKNPTDPDFGMIECHFGRLNMTNAQLKENLVALFESINRFKPLNLVDGKQFFERVMISSSASQEIFLLRFWELFDEYQDPETLCQDDEKLASSN